MKYKKILLLNPWVGEVFPPPGLGYLQAALKYVFPNIDIQACDIDSPKIDETYDVVCVSFHSFSVKYATMIRDKFKGSILVCGGHHPSSLPDQMYQIGYDHVIIGEGENQLVEFIGDIKSPFEDVNQYPYPDYTGFTGNWSMGYPIISSRGCPFTCDFCASANFWKRKWYPRSPKNIIDEILHMIKNFSMKTWMFEDDNFTLDQNRTIEICERLVKDVFPLIGKPSWQCASRAENLTNLELCAHLKKAGCDKIWLGIESLSQDSLDRCKKNTTVQKMLHGIKNAWDCGIPTMSQFIIGMPGDSLSNIQETVKNINGSFIKHRGCNICWVLPGTKVYTKSKEYGFSDDSYLIDGAPFYTCEQSIDTLNKWVDMVNLAKR